MRSSKADLESVVDAGVKVLVYAGDAVSIHRCRALLYGRRLKGSCRITSSITLGSKGWCVIGLLSLFSLMLKVESVDGQSRHEV